MDDSSTSAPAATTRPLDSSVPALSATAEPATVAAGLEVTITPAKRIDRRCLDQVNVFEPDGAMIALLREGDLFAAQPDGTLDVIGCVNPEPPGAVTFAVPSGLPPGSYVMCLTESLEPQGCAQVDVTAGDGAWAEPLAVIAGEQVTITPAGTIQRNCGNIVTASHPEAPADVALIVGDDWLYDPNGPPPTQPPCLGDATDAPLTFDIPIDVDSGRWNLCIDAMGAPGACAVVTVIGQPVQRLVTSAPLEPCVAPTPPPTLTNGTEPGETQTVRGMLGYFWAATTAHYVMQLPLAEYDDFTDKIAQGGWTAQAGRYEAVVSQVAPDQPSNIVLRDAIDINHCVRWYTVPLDLNAAKLLATDWLAKLSS